ncbi:sensor domain-containing diguanylate cyclase [Rossellomorea aquimaris]|uniref:sensor domain-containing diguanylate cyclase n=1 Tax=Rossellomorea aquimaris TaxID=189382 RepID=UPI0007D09C22|nr:sensor domain-containing diguanylate cyclase [Rossellomorea aquimaris]
MYVNNSLDTYKSKLFDLIYEEMSIEQHHNLYLHKWLEIVKVCLKVESAFLYLFHDSSYYLFQPKTTREAQPLLSESSLKESFHPQKMFFYNEIELDESYNIGLRFPKEDGTPFALLLLNKKNLKETLNEKDLQSFWKVSNQFLHHTEGIQTVLEDERRYRELFKVTEIFHSTRDVKTLLIQIIETLKQVFPNDDYHLLLSNDHYDFGDLPIKNFDFENANPFAMQSFVNGSIEVEQECILYAPLKGKQGIYGVLEVNSNSNSNSTFTEQKIEFIRLLAYTAGSALENAKLYEQSKRLITDLQLINETSHKLNLNLRLTETLTFLKNQVKRSFHASAIGFVLFEKGKTIVLEESSSLFFTNEGNKYITYVKERIEKERDSIFLGDASDRVVGGEKFASLMAVPMVQNNSLLGFCIVLHEDPYMFSFDMYKLLQSFIHHSTLAITNATLREKLEHLVITDHMTKLFARHYLDETMDTSMKKDDQGVLLLIDIDDFKAINDNYGHQVGDEVIIQVANLIKKMVDPHGLVARWGGEEIAVYFPSLPQEKGVEIAQGIIEQTSAETQPRVTLSCGVSTWRKDEEKCPKSVKELVKRADEALYLAKNNGKNQVVEDCDKTIVIE